MWVSEGTAVENTSGWSLKDVDLTAYASKTIRITLFHVANRVGTAATESTGWYIDDVQVVKKAPAFTGDFEAVGMIGALMAGCVAPQQRDQRVAMVAHSVPGQSLPGTMGNSPTAV